MSFALVAFILQASLPFLAASCPMHMGAVATASQAATAQAMPADCPMLGGAHALPEAGDTKSGSHKAHGVAYCPLCNALSTLNGFVAAGLIALPPPAENEQPVSYSALAAFAPASPTGSFSARAPPVSI